MNNNSSIPNLGDLLSHTDWIFGLARRLVLDPNLADDVVQNAWLEVLEHPPAHDQNPRGFLSRVVHHSALRILRGEGRRKRREQTVAKSDALPATDELVQRAGLQRDLVTHVLALQEPYRAVLLLRYFEDLSSTEIAKHLDRPRNTVQTQIQRGLDQLRERLDGEYGDRRAWGLALLPLARGGRLAAPAVAAGLGAGGLLLSVLAVASLVGLAVQWSIDPDPIVDTSGDALQVDRLLSDEDQDLPTGAELAGEQRDALEPERLGIGEAPPVEPQVAQGPVGNHLRARLVNLKGEPLAGVEVRQEPTHVPRIENGFLFYGGQGVGIEQLLKARKELSDDLDRGTLEWLLGSLLRDIPERFHERVGILLSGGSVDWGTSFATSAADGWFEMPDKAEGELLLPEGYINLGLHKGRRSGGELEQLLLATQSVRVAGQVRDGQGHALEGATIRVSFSVSILPDFSYELEASSPCSFQVSSDVEGRFVFASVPDVLGLSYSCTKPGYRSDAEYLPNSGSPDLQFMLEKQTAKPFLSGRVLHRDGTAAPEVWVGLGNNGGSSDEFGVFRFEVRSPKENGVLSAWKKGLEPGLMPGVGAQMKASGGSLDGVLIRLGGPTLAIRGVVTDAQGKALAGVQVILDRPTSLNPNSSSSPEEEQVSTDAEGRFEMHELSSRGYRLRLVDLAAKRVFVTHPIVPGGDVTLSFPANDEVFSMAGVVLDRHGVPLAGVTVEHALIKYRWGDAGDVQFYSHEPVESLQSGPNGRFFFEGLTANADLRISGAGIKSRVLRLADVDRTLGLQPVVVDAFYRYRLVLVGEKTWDRCEFHGPKGRITFIVRKPDVTSHMNSWNPSSNPGSPRLEVDIDATHLVLFRGKEEVRRLPISGTRNEVTKLLIDN